MLETKKIYSPKTHPIFEGLTEAEKDFLFQQGKARVFPRKQTLFRYGDPVEEFFLLYSGTVKLFRISPLGRVKAVGLLSGGSMICGREIIEGIDHHMVSAEAAEDASAMEFTPAWLRENVEKYPRFTLNLLSQISYQARWSEVDEEHQTQMSAAQLVACFLQRLCAAHNFNPGGFDLPYSKSLIASRLGIELETFSRALLTLRAVGVEVKGRRVVLNDLEALERFVCGRCSISAICPARQTLDQRILAVFSQVSGEVK